MEKKAEEAESQESDSTEEPAAAEGGDPASAPAAEANEHTAPPPPDPAMLQPKLDAKSKQELVQEARRTVDESRLPYAQIAKLFPATDPRAVMPGMGRPDNRDGGRRMPALGRTLVAAARLAAKAAAAQGAVAVERYRLKNGKLPDEWETMVPDFIPRPILDPFTVDSTIMLRTTDTGYVVYSIGQNEKDDGGTEGDVRPPLDQVFRVLGAAPAGK